jgi:hypothetical protein
MKTALFTIDGNGTPLAHHLQNEGEEVYVGFIRSWKTLGVECDENAEGQKRRLALFNGMFNYKMSSNELISYLLAQKNKKEWRIFCDFNYQFSIADILRKAGFTGLFPTEQDASYEKDRKKAKDLVKRRFEMLTIGDYTEFSKVQEGIKFLNQNKETLYVLKGFNEFAGTVVPYSNDIDINRAFLINALNTHRKDYEKDGYILEEKIPDLIEFTPEAIAFDGKLVGVSVDIEHKLLGSRSGSQTGCTLDTVFWIDEKTKCYEWFLKPLEDMMFRQNQMTIWDASVLYSPSRGKYFFGEFCFNRPGYDSVFTEVSTLGKTLKFFDRIWSGKPLYVKGITKPFASAVRVFNLVPSNTHSGLTTSGDLVITNTENPDIWLWDVEEKNGELFTVGYDKNMCIVTGSGETFEESVDAAYENLKEVHFDAGYHLEAHDALDAENPQSLLSRYNALKKLDIF